jgi:hypothetical protein
MPPRTVQSQELLMAVVARVPGAIGYVMAEKLDGSVQALTLDGKAHSAPGYPLTVP